MARRLIENLRICLRFDNLARVVPVVLILMVPWLRFILNAHLLLDEALDGHAAFRAVLLVRFVLLAQQACVACRIIATCWEHLAQGCVVRDSGGTWSALAHAGAGYNHLQVVGWHYVAHRAHDRQRRRAVANVAGRGSLVLRCTATAKPSLDHLLLLSAAINHLLQVRHGR